MHSVCIPIYVSMNLYRYLCAHGISGLAARGDWEQFKVPLKMTMEWTQRYTPRPWWSEFGQALGGQDRVNSEMHSTLWSSKVRDALAASDDRGGLQEYLKVVDLEAVDGRRARCWDSIHRAVNSKLWECDEVTLPMKLFWHCENEGTAHNVRCMLYSVCAALGVCCTRC